MVHNSMCSARRHGRIGRALRVKQWGRCLAAAAIILFMVKEAFAAISEISPNFATVGGSALTLTVTGSDFTEESVVQWNGVDRPSNFISATELTADIPASDLENRGFAQITVVTPGSDLSGPVDFAVRLVPAVSGVDPNSAIVGSSGFVLTIAGSNFDTDSQGLWNGSARPTSFVNANSLTMTVDGSDVQNPGTAEISVSNPDPGGLSGTVLFSIAASATNPEPSLSQISPTGVAAGSSGFTITATGSGFVASSVIRWNGTDRPTTFVNDTTLTAGIPASDVASRGTADVTVFTSAPGGGTSGAVTFSISLIPAISGLQPGSAVVGSAGFELTVSGNGFAADSVVRWNGSNRPTTFVNAGTLSAAIPTSDLLVAGENDVTIFNQEPGGVSNVTQFTVTSLTPIPNPSPQISSVSPVSVDVGNPGFTLTVTGADFVESSVVRWNGSDRLTTFVNSGALTAAISSADAATRGFAQVTVFTPVPGGGISSAQTCSVNLVPAIVAISPNSVVPGSPNFVLNVSGSRFAEDSLVLWDGSPRDTTFIDSNTLRATIVSADVSLRGMHGVTVTNAAPGGVSNIMNFAVDETGNPIPVLLEISPTGAEVGGPAFLLTARGTSFVPGSTIRWNQESRPTTFVNDRTLNTEILASDLVVRGFAEVTVHTPANGGGTSATQTFRIRLIPAIERIEPSSTTAQNLSFTMTVLGSKFDRDSEIWWNAQKLPTTFLSATTLTAPVTPADFASVGPYQVAVINPDPGGRSNVIPFGAELDPVRVYPNPWRADRYGASAPRITFDRLSAGSEVKIFALTGQWVTTIRSSNGVATWSLTSDDNVPVASGFYLYVVSGIDGRSGRGKISVLR